MASMLHMKGQFFRMGNYKKLGTPFTFLQCSLISPITLMRFCNWVCPNPNPTNGHVLKNTSIVMGLETQVAFEISQLPHSSITLKSEFLSGPLLFLFACTIDH
jgi:hypothetical protein